ncbi:MAG: alanine racemase, partial [Deltaproteobacteria bacterium]|nr:alanine racemase [Deltaproteobacteria bacterium]
MSVVRERVVARVSLAAIGANFEAIRARAQAEMPLFQGAVPMVKCNAYGHGLLEVGRALEKKRAALALGVAALAEGERLRAGGARKPIWVFSDTSPWDDAVAARARRANLTPVIHTLDDLRRLLARPRAAPRAFHLKFNTGMNRLGIEATDALKAKRLLEAAGLAPEGICTHFACADEPSRPITRAQVEIFRAIAALFHEDVSHIHCSNTSASLSARRLGLSDFCDVIRPGIGLYGYSDVATARLKPALRLSARVVSSRMLEVGDSVGYGGTYRAAARGPQCILAIGYGDGLMRRLSNATVRIGGRGVRVLGRVSMDLTALALRAKPG